MPRIGGVPETPGGGKLVYVAKAHNKTGATVREQDALTPADVDEWLGVIREAARRLNVASSAVNQIGAALFHQNGSSLAMVKTSPGRLGSSIMLAAMPCRSGRTPVTMVQ